MISVRTVMSLLLIGLCMLAAPGAARAIENGGTVFNCETDLDLSAIAEDGDELVNYLDKSSIPIADATALDLSSFDLQGHYGLYDVVSGGPAGERKNFIYIEMPEISLDICHNADLSSSLAGAKVKNITLIAFEFFSIPVGTYLPTAAVRVEITTPDGRIITGVPDAAGVVRDLTNHTLSGYRTYIRGVDISGLDAGTYTARAVWESPQGFADYAEDSNAVNFTVLLNGISIGSYSENLMKNNPFIITISGSPGSDYFLYVEDAGIATERYPSIKQGQPSVTITAAAFPDSADPAAKTLAESERAGAGGAYVPDTAAVVTTDAEGFCSVEFGTTSTTVPTTYFITVVDPADVSRIDQARVAVKGGDVTIAAEGAGAYFLGEEIKLSGTNTDSDTVYLFMTGPNLGDQNGVKLDNLSAYAADGQYVVRDVESDDTWEYRWDTAALSRGPGVLDRSTYTVYACSNNVDGQNTNVDKYHLSGVRYQTFSLVLKVPTLSLDRIDSVVAKGDPLTIGGFVTGDPDQVKLWIFGENYRLFGANVTVEDDGTFAYTIGRNETPSLYAGQYYVVVQHPGCEHVFNVFPVAPGSTTDFRIANSWSSETFNLGSLHAADAYIALTDMITAPESDDTYSRATFNVEEAWIEIDPVANHTVGETFMVTGSTNLAVGDRLFFDVVRASFDPTDPDDEPGYGASGNTTVRAGTDRHEWSFEVDTTKFNAEPYMVVVESVDADVTRRTTFSMDCPAGGRAAFTASPVLGVAPLTVRFTDLSTNASAWVWSFGDGTTSKVVQHPSHEYTTAGTYTVTLSVNGGDDTATTAITVLPVLFGDATNNGAVDQADTLRVLKEVVGMAAKPASGTDLFRKTDVHKNGEIDIGDALYIAQYNVGLRGPWFELVGA